MTIVYVVIAYFVGMAAVKIVEAMKDPDPMRLRDWVITIVTGWLLVPFTVSMLIMTWFFIGVENFWKFIKKVW